MGVLWGFGLESMLMVSLFEKVGNLMELEEGF